MPLWSVLLAPLGPHLSRGVTRSARRSRVVCCLSVGGGGDERLIKQRLSSAQQATLAAEWLSSLLSGRAGGRKGVCESSQHKGWPQDSPRRSDRSLARAPLCSAATRSSGRNHDCPRNEQCVQYSFQFCRRHHRRRALWLRLAAAAAAAARTGDRQQPAVGRQPTRSAVAGSFFGEKDEMIIRMSSVEPTAVGCWPNAKRC